MSPDFVRLTLFRRIALLAALFVLIIAFGAEIFAHQAYAHAGDDTVSNEKSLLVERIRAQSVNFAYTGGIVLLIGAVLALLTQDKSEVFKKFLFSFMALAALVPTTYFVATTIYLNNISITGGPVHWHADFKIFGCDEELSPPTPLRFSNKVGTPLFHEHEDRRIHVEGVVVERNDVTLEHFFEVQGGFLDNNSFAVPTAEGVRTFTNGDLCADGARGMWQTFVYRTHGKIAEQAEIVDYPHYVISPETLVPPGDCIIFEFGAFKERTDKLCDFYAIEAHKGTLEIR